MNWLVEHDVYKHISQTDEDVDGVNIFATLEEAKVESCSRLEEAIEFHERMIDHTKPHMIMTPKLTIDEINFSKKAEDEGIFYAALQALNEREPREERLHSFFTSLGKRGFATLERRFMNEENLKTLRKKMAEMDEPYGYCYYERPEAKTESTNYCEYCGKPAHRSYYISLRFGAPEVGYFEESDIDDDAVGRTICQILDEMSIPYFWEGSADTCIHIDLSVDWPEITVERDAIKGEQEGEGELGT